MRNTNIYEYTQWFPIREFMKEDSFQKTEKYPNRELINYDLTVDDQLSLPT